MQGVVFRGIWLLAFLLSAIGQAEELDSVKELENRKDTEDLIKVIEKVDLNKTSESPDDLKNILADLNSQDAAERSGAVAQSSSHGFTGPSMNEAVANSYSSGPSLAYSDDYEGSFQSKARAADGYSAKTSPFSPLGPEFSPYMSAGSSLSKAEAQAISSDGNPYAQGLNPYPYSSSYPYSPGLSSAQAQAETDSGFYQAAPLATPVLGTYYPGMSSDRKQALADDGFLQAITRTDNNMNLYSQKQNSVQVQTQADDRLYPFNFYQGSGSAQRQALPQSESYPSTVESISILSKPRYSQRSYSPSVLISDDPYSLGPSSAQEQKQADSKLYQPIPIPDPRPSTFEPLLPPYKEPSYTQTQNRAKTYQTRTIPNPSPHLYELWNSPNVGSTMDDFSLSGLRLKSNQAQAQIESDTYQPIPIPNPNPVSYETFLVPYKEPVYPIKIKNEGSSSTFPNILRNNLTQLEAQTSSDIYQPFPILDSNTKTQSYNPLMIPYRGQNSDQAQVFNENESYQPSIIRGTKSDFPFNLHNLVRTRESKPTQNYIDLDTNPTSKSGWDSYAHKYPYLPSIPNPQSYTSGAVAAPTNYDFKNHDSNEGMILYKQKLRSYGLDYPPELHYQPAMNAQRPYNVDSNAKSRLILPDEYVFPNKIPGGENAVQCLKENEFHHFWSQELDCLVCICLNEYGLLTPVCASCGSCHYPPEKHPDPFPQLPEYITVRPATPEPFEPLPEPFPAFPQPEPYPTKPFPEKYQPIPIPEVYPLPYPEPVSPSSNVPEPEPFSKPTRPTLPIPPATVTCNPLPSGQPFTNPLHPCQICICRESYVSGKPDVQIQCKENPQCISPADLTTLPPIPDASVPIPLPMCEKFPEHVLFPHPTDACKLCKCSKYESESGASEQHITCYPHPDCVTKFDPVTEPGNLVPPLPIPIEPQKLKPYQDPDLVIAEPLKPVPMPEIVTVEPLPWPPITTTALVPTTPVTLPVLTPRPGPLPGPSPHESCHPYPPNQAFQHPWDECQICLCTEAHAVGMVTVEVNCYTKPSCCIEPPDSVKPAITGYSIPYPGISNVVNGLDLQSLPSGPQPNVLVTSTFRPAPIFPRPVKVYPGNTHPQGYSIAFSRLKPDEAFADPSSTYPYQPNYHPGYGNQQYPDYPARLPSPSGPYKPSSYGYTGHYPYSQGDVGTAYPGPKEPYQPYEPRYHAGSASNVYPPVYQRPHYEIPQMYRGGQIRDSYASAQTLTQGGSNVQNLAQAYEGLRSKSGADGVEDSDEA